MELHELNVVSVSAFSLHEEWESGSVSKLLGIVSDIVSSIFVVIEAFAQHPWIVWNCAFTVSRIQRFGRPVSIHI
jgi:hypothetical protein